jgi:hypothetical protein
MTALGERSDHAPVQEAAEGKDAADHLAAGHALDDFLPLETDATEADEPFRISVYSAHELAALELPAAAEPLAGPFLRRGMATLVGGLTGHGKTTLISHLVRAAADGSAFLGETGIGGVRTLILDLEQHLTSIQREIREAGLEGSDIVDYAPIPEGLALDKRNDQLAALERVFDAKPYDLLVVDPFYKLHEADSSDEVAARLLVALLRRWINERGFALLTATHCRKLAAGRTVITLDDLFGSSLFTRDPELVLGIQRHGELTKLHVFKSREPGLDQGQTFELLFTRDRGYWLRPNKDPKEIEAESVEIITAVVDFVGEHPGASTNQVQKALPWGREKVRAALDDGYTSGLISEPVPGSRNSLRWYLPNHVASTCLGGFAGQVSEDASRATLEATCPDLPDLPVGEKGSQAGQVAEATIDEEEIERLAALAHGLQASPT